MSTAPPHSTWGNKVPTGKPPGPHLAGRQSSVGYNCHHSCPLGSLPDARYQVFWCETCFLLVSVAEALAERRRVASPSLPSLPRSEGPCPVGQDAAPSPLVIQEHQGQDPRSAHGCPASHPFPKGAGNPTYTGSSQSRGPKTCQHWTRHPSGPFPWVLPLLNGRVLFRKGLRSWGVLGGG